MSTPTTAPAGWYPTNDGRQRWWDGVQWTNHYAPAAQPAPYASAPMTAAGLTNSRQVVYNRQQTGHSIVKHILLGWIALYIPTIYYAVSPNHYFHA